VAEREAVQLRQALDALTKMRVRLEAAERAKAEPIAIVGLGCRFPGGVHDPASFWTLLMNGVDAVTEVPADRWDAGSLYDPDPLAPGKISTRWGGFLDGLDGFDAAFFGISPREAARMDPQQRLLLEAAWDALDDAALSAPGLAGRAAGVFVGVHSHSNDYWNLQARDRSGLDAYAGTGTSHSVLAGRLSYLLDLRGPSMAIDTACSSSLVAVHLACQALRAGECGLALAAGVNVILSPEFTVAASRMQMMAADGRCKAFDARADGFVRGEGCGVVVLKRLADAVAAGDPVRAVIRGSGVNQDGRTNGLTAPNGHAQAALIRGVLAGAGVVGAEIGYVEAHGTGTPLGDPIEIEALAAALGPRGAASPCQVGSVKANVGHLEGAAGIAGLIKATLTVQHGVIPPQVHFQRLNPHISLDGTGLAIGREARPWPAGGAPRRAGVSAFGWSGTNAHLVLEEAPRRPAAAAVDESAPGLLVISARSAKALDAALRGYRSFLIGASEPLGDIACTAAMRRTPHPYRAAIVAGSKPEAVERLQALIEGEACRGVATGSRDEEGPPRVVFVFPGQGSQWLGMGRGLLASSPVFRQALERCGEALREHVSWSLIDELTAGEATSRLAEIDVVQPVLWAIQVALAAQWRAWGVEPAAVVGHSMGEIAAAHVAGALALPEAASVICRRSRLLRDLSGRGSMALVDLSQADAEVALRGHEAAVAVAVLNSPRSTVISGDPTAIQEVLDVLRERGVFCRDISVDVASHSPQVDALLAPLRAALGDLAPRAASVPIYSTVTATPCSGSDLDAGYWARNLREPVLFSRTLQALAHAGHTTFLEISPHPILTPAIDETLASLGIAGAVIPSLRRHEDERSSMLESLGALWAAGHPVAWERLFPVARPPVALPPYPWQRERFWLEPESGRRADAPGPVREGEHPLLGRRLEIAEAPERSAWEVEVDGDAPDARLEHRLQGVGVLAASAIIAMIGAAAREVSRSPRVISDVELRRAVILPEPGARLRIQTVLVPLPEDEARVSVYARGADGTWVLHAEARLGAPASSRGARAEDPEAIQVRLEGAEPGETFYQHLRGLDVEIPEGLRIVQRLRRDGGEVLAKIDDRGAFTSGAHDSRRLAEALDACFQLPAAVASSDGSASVSMPVRIDEVRVEASAKAVTAHARRRERGSEVDGTVWDVRLLDALGAPVLEMSGLRMKDVVADAGSRPADLYELQWTPSTAPRHGSSTARSGTWIVLADSDGVANALARRLDAEGSTAVLIKREERRHEVLRERLGAGVARGVVDLWSLDGSADPAQSSVPPTPEACQDALEVLHALLEVGGAPPPRLWLVTRGAQPVGPGPADAPLAAALWGLGRVLGEEHPEMWGGLVDLDPAGSAEEGAGNLLAELGRADDEAEVAYRRGRRQAPRLVRWRTGAASVAPGLRPDASYLITGGGGALGLRVARWMARRGARHLVLLSRTPLPPRAEWSALAGVSGARAAAITEIETLGARVHHGAVDVADRAALSAFLEGFHREGWPPVRGVVHAAAVIDDRLLQRLDPSSLEQVWRAKALGAWSLHRILENEPLDFFALFGSLGSILGQTGQGSYAAANAFLDGLAHYRTARGLPAVTIDWGAWTDLGFAATTGGRQVVAELRAQGIAPIAPERALELLGQALASGRPQLAAFTLDRSRGPEPAGSRRPRLLADLPGGARSVATGDHHTLAGELRALPADGRRARLEGLLCEKLGRVLKIAADRVELRKPLGAIGVDSLIALEFRRHLEAALDLALPATMVWNHPTVVDLAAYLSGRIAPDATSSGTVETAPAQSLGRAVDRVDQLSEEGAAQALLAARRPSHGR
jgi:myxalamid-type polyketide synthase MxaE and MxaD